MESLGSIACNLFDPLPVLRQGELLETISDFELDPTERIGGLVATRNNNQSAKFTKFPSVIPIDVTITTPHEFYSILKTQGHHLLSAFPSSQLTSIEDCFNHLRRDLNPNGQTTDKTFVERDFQQFDNAWNVYWYRMALLNGFVPL